MLMIEFFKHGIQYTPARALCSSWRPKEDDGALAIDVDDGAVSELDGTLHHLVKLREHVVVTRHVVHRALVEVPALEVIIVTAARAEERLSLGLVQVD
jgi:hypothetical protein